jgi:putative membrane protein
MRLSLFATAASLALGGCATAQSAADFLAGSPGIREGSGYAAAAAASDQFEIQSSQLALSQAQRPEVRDFAQMLVMHHTQTTQRLSTAAQASGLTPPPPALTAAQQRMLTQLQQAPAGTFDQVYLQQQVPAHEMALRLHHNYALGGDNPELRRVAASAVTVVQRHLDEIRRIDPPRRGFFDFFRL